MKLYTCTNCSNPLYFENSICLKCNHSVGFDASKFNLIALDNNTNGYTAVNNKNALYRFCSNAALGTCNWLIPDAQIPPFCSACELNRTIPELGNFKNQEK